MAEVSKVFSTIERNYIIKLLEKGKRLDGRGLLEFRPVEIQTNVVPKAEGSADVKLGATRIIAGVKYEIGAPFPDTPNTGVVTVMSEFVPMASPAFEPGPPGEESIEHARVVDRGLRHSDSIDYDALCIVPGKQVYVLFADMYVMNHAGNLWDCGHIACLAALISAKIPGARVLEDGETVEFSGSYTTVPIKSIPVTLTFAKIGDYLILDPNLAEEMVLDARLTVTVSGKGTVASMQKGGHSTLTQEEIVKCTRDAVELAAKLREQINFEQYRPVL
ncbi:MAG: exosome complex protein Rrp42 [Promethearchaeota archaeon]